MLQCKLTKRQVYEWCNCYSDNVFVSGCNVVVTLITFEGVVESLCL